MSDERHIFLSYRSIEADFALKLAADLKNAGVNLWMDRLDGIRGGDDWRRQIEDALSPDHCALMIAALSPEYLNADYCRNELARADRLKIPFLPALLYPVPDIPIQIERLQYILFCQQDKSGKLERTWRETDLYDSALQNLLKALPAAQKGAVPDAETQYLTSLISELESRKGVLEYVELSAQADAPKEPDPIRPEPCREDEWAAGFSLLAERPVGARRVLQAVGVYSKKRHQGISLCPA
jgi:TIR domain